MKGSVMDLRILIVVLPIFIFSLFIGVYIIDEFDTQMSAMNETPNVSKEIINKGYNAFSVFDELILFVTVAFGITTIVSAYLIRSHPVFFFISFMLTGILMFVAGIMTNVYEKFASTSTFSSIATSFPIIQQIMYHLPEIVLIFGGLVAIAMYSSRGDTAV